MKLTTVLLFSLFFQLSATVFSQTNGKLNLKAENETISNILKTIEEQTEFRFLYNSNNIDVNRKTDIDCQSKNVEEVLQLLFAGTDVTYRTFNTNYVLFSEKSDFASASQQQRIVTGKVTDSSGGSLPGVSVIIKGTTSGVITDASGRYTIPNIPANAILQFSFVGMKGQEFVVGNKAIIDVTMEDATIGIEEVVAVGYGTQKKQAVTGAVAVAPIKDLKSVPVNNILETVKGAVAGLNVSGTNTAGEVASMSIRGQNTQAASTAPLIVVDGVIFAGNLNDISTNDVESFTVLKDASAAAVYGSRSANGVILIETKKGTSTGGKPNFEVKSSYGVSNELEHLKVYDGPGYIQRLLDIRTSNGQEAIPENILNYLQPEEQKNYSATPDHKPTLSNPHSLFSQMGYSSNTSISISSRTEKTRYFISGNFIKQRGVILYDNYKNINGRINIESELTGWLTLGVKSYYSLKDYSGAAIYGAGTSMSGSSVSGFSPYATLKDDTGAYLKFPQTTTSFNSPYWQIATADIDYRNTLNAIVSGVIKVPWVKGLTYTLNWSNTLNWNERSQFWDKNTLDGAPKNGTGFRTYSRTYRTLADNLVKYNNTFNEKHNIDITLLYEFERSANETQTASGQDFDDTGLGTYKLENGKTQTVDTGGGETKNIGKMARATYTFDNKYSITGTIRQDGFSGFSLNKKWGTFPSIGANWNISKENFMKGITPINNLALRASYGSNGNQSIGAYSTLAKMGFSKYIFYNDASYTITEAISTMANNNLGWETTTGLNFGIDFSLLDHRISGSIDGYRTKTTNLLFTLSLPTISGKSSILSNVGEIQNRGFELNMTSVNIKKKDFSWNTDYAFSLNRNKVVTILGKDANGDGKEDDLISDGFFIGRPLGTIYNYKVIGMYQQSDKDNGTIMTGMRPGDYILEDVPDADGNKDGKITSDKDRQFLGNSNPNFRWSMTNTFKYKDLSFMFYLYSIWGGNGYFLSGNNTPYTDGYANAEAINHPVYDYWTPTNTGAMFPRTDYSARAAYRGTKYFDRSFIKLQKVALSYDFTKYVKPWGIKGLSCTASADNLLTYAPHWVGLDPETNMGLKDTAIPSIRTYLFSVNLNF